MTPDRLLWPWLLLSAAAALILLAVWIARGRRDASMMYTGEAWAREIGGGWRAALAWLPGALRLLALLALAVALARPQDSTGERRTRTEGVALQLVVDRSGSMRESIDQYGRETRLDAVKRVAAAFIRGTDSPDDPESATPTGREGDLIGLIAFARYADTICPLIQSHGPLLDMLADLETAQIRAEDGTAIGDALALAAARLKNAEREVGGAAASPVPKTSTQDGEAEPGDAAEPPSFRIASKAIILLTDGRNTRGDIDPGAVARLCSDWGIKVYAIGIGGEPPRGLGGLRFGMGPGVDEQMLTELAEITGGRYWLAQNADALGEIYAEIDALEKTEIETAEVTDFEERFAPFAALALGLVLMEMIGRCFVFRRVP